MTLTASSGLPFSAIDSALATASSTLLSASAGVATNAAARTRIHFLISVSPSSRDWTPGRRAKPRRKRRLVRLDPLVVVLSRLSDCHYSGPRRGVLRPSAAGGGLLCDPPPRRRPRGPRCRVGALAMDHSPCQSCRRPPTESLLSYRRGSTIVHDETFLQCDICE